MLHDARFVVRDVTAYTCCDATLRPDGLAMMMLHLVGNLTFAGPAAVYFLLEAVVLILLARMLRGRLKRAKARLKELVETFPN